jgi:hypothetical protein
MLATARRYDKPDMKLLRLRIESRLSDSRTKFMLISRAAANAYRSTVEQFAHLSSNSDCAEHVKA